jgi:hypothetical protein
VFDFGLVKDTAAAADVQITSEQSDAARFVVVVECGSGVA